MAEEPVTNNESEEVKTGVVKSDEPQQAAGQ